MSRWIDADALKEDVARLHVLNDEAEIRRAYEYNPHVTSTDFEETLVSVFDAIDDAPSIDIEPRRGEWIGGRVMTSRVEELQRMCDNINENGGLDSGEWHTALLAQIAQNLAVIADVMMADRKTEPNSSEKPNNCEPQTELVNNSPILAKDLVDDEFNPYDEECMRCMHLKLRCEFVPSYCHYEPRDEPHHSGEVTEMVEPQTDGYMTAEQTVDCAWK